MIVLTYGKLVDIVHLFLILNGVLLLAGIKFYLKKIYQFLTNLVVMEIVPEAKSKAVNN